MNIGGGRGRGVVYDCFDVDDIFEGIGTVRWELLLG